MNAVVTITSGDFYTKMGETTHPLMEAYAKRIGAEFVVLEGIGDHEIPHYRKLDMKELFEKYDRILYVDTDILIRADAPNLFDIVPEEKIGAFNEGQFVERAINFYAYMKQVGFSSKWNGKYYNTGVLVVSKAHADLFSAPPKEDDNFKEQSYLNVMLIHKNYPIKDLSYRFNRMYCMDHLTGEERFDSYFMHYAGVNLQMKEDEQIALMKKDLKVWEDAAPGYKFQKHIAVHVTGGMGDQITAEPVIRFMMENTYKGDEIILFSDWPELFSHLDVKAYKHRTQVMSPNQYYQMNTLQSPEHESWQYMTHPLIHGVDFSALQCVRMILPLKDKGIRLPLSKEAVDSFMQKVDGNALDVLIHPGRGWDSKTFPADVWQSYIDILVNDGKRVGVIGKRVSKEQGIVEVDTSKCVDLIDKLSIPELIAAVAYTAVLISNDSAPIHIAGAFDNWIGLIATCKHPDKVLPFRGEDGRQDHKAEALESWPMYDMYNHQPSQVEGATIDYCTEEQMRRACPPAEYILDFVSDGLCDSDDLFKKIDIEYPGAFDIQLSASISI